LLFISRFHVTSATAVTSQIADRISGCQTVACTDIFPDTYELWLAAAGAVRRP